MRVVVAMSIIPEQDLFIFLPDKVLPRVLVVKLGRMQSFFVHDLAWLPGFILEVLE